MGGGSSIETCVILHELPLDQVLAHSLVQPALAAVGLESEVLIELEMLLSQHLANLRPDEIARFDHGSAPELRTLSVQVPHATLRGKLEIKTPIDVPCVVTKAQPERQSSDLWVHIVPLAATVYVRAAEDFDAVVRAEIQRIARARELTGTEYVALLPAARTWVQQLRVNHARSGPSGSTAVSGLRGEIAAAQRRDADALLRSVARPFSERTHARPLLDRERELSLLKTLLGGKQRASVVLVGEQDTGKSALLASWYEGERELGQAPSLYATSGAQLSAGMGGFGEWQAQLERVLRAAELLDAVLYIEDLHDFLLSRRSQGADVAGFMRPWLDAGRVRMVFELQKRSLDEAERRQSGFLSALTRVVLEPLPKTRDLAVLSAHAAHHRKHEPHRQQIGNDALAALVDLADRYLPYGVRPGALVGLYDELRALDRTRVSEQTEPIHAHEAYAWFSGRTGVPLFLLREDTSLRRANLEDELHRLLVGQDEAKRAVIDTVCTVKARLAPRDRPLATFLFVGPTGVGKTELARALAQLLFGDAERLVRFDMSEYADAYAAERLMRGDEQSDGLLTRKIREQPFCVLLLDEIEKAHPSVYDLLLQVLGEARLSDARGRTAFFHNAIVIMTSNLGAGTRVVAGFGEAETGDRTPYLKAAREAFRPEFLNRIDRIVPFAPLSRGELPLVVRMLVRRISERRGLRERGLSVEVSDAALTLLAEGGFSEAYGARGVRRHLEATLATPLARLCALHARAPSCNSISVELSTKAGEDARTHPFPSVEQAGLRFALQRRERGTALRKRNDDDLTELRNVRRKLGRQLVLPRIEALEMQRATWIVDLTQARKKKQPYSSFLSSLESRLAACSTVLDELHAAYGELCSVEDLCLSALRKGEQNPSFLPEIAQASRAFERALYKALLLDEAERHAITLLVCELDDRRALELWLTRYLQEAPRLGHRVRVHIDHNTRTERYGNALEPDAALRELLAPARTFRSVLVCAEGPDAFVQLALERGIVVYRDEQQRDSTLAVFPCARFADLTELELANSVLLPPPWEALQLLKRPPYSRLFEAATGRVTLARGRTSLACTAAQHFARLEDIVLAHLLEFEAKEPLDRDEAFEVALRRGRTR